MANRDIHEVTRTEHHWLPTCPCGECRAERDRRSSASPPANSIRHIPPETAHVLGFIRTPRPPHGSLARELMIKSKQLPEKKGGDDG